MTIWTACLILILGVADAPASKPSADGPVAPAGQPTEPFADKPLSREEAAAYRNELKAAEAANSLAPFREATEEAREAARRVAAKARRDADAEAAADVQLRADRTRKMLGRRHPQRRKVLTNHYKRLHEIADERRQATDRAAAESSRQHRILAESERNIAVIEKMTTTLAQVAVHAKYAQTKTGVAALGQAISGLPAVIGILDATKDSELQTTAAANIEEAFSQAMEVIADQEPNRAARILVNNQQEFRVALTTPGWQGLSAYLDDAWRSIGDQIALSDAQSRAAKYWTKQAQKAAKLDGEPAIQRPVSSPETAKPVGKKKAR